MELDTLTYNILLRDAFLIKLKETEEGREYLEKSWLYSQQEPDRAALRKQFN